MNFTDNLYYKLDKISTFPGKKDKLALARGFSPVELRVLQLALDPTVNFYIAKLALPLTHGTEQWSEDEYQLLRDLSSRKLSGNAALERVSFHLRELSPASGELLRRVILKDLRCGMGVTILNTAFPGLIPDFAYMRCTLPKDSNYAKFDWSLGILSQLKANGMFARIDHDNDGNIQITSRQGKTFPPTAMKLLSEDMRFTVPRGTQTHGELTVWRDGVIQSRAMGNGILNRLQSDGEELQAGDEIRFDAWDQIPLSQAVAKGSFSTPYDVRFSKLKKQIEDAARPSAMLIETRVCYSEVEAGKHYREVLAQGLEGTVCKHPHAEWRDGDSKDQVKFKLEVDVDLEIVGFNAGTEGKRTQDTFGSIRCRTSDGLLEVAVGGFNRDMEKYLHENRASILTKIMCVRSNEVSPPCETNPLHSLLHPRFVELRDDKYAADDLPAVLAQFEAAVA